MSKNYFTLFGLPIAFLQEEAVIKSSFLKLQREIHPDNFVDATPQEKHLSVDYAALVNQAYQTLLDPLKRAIYLLSLRGVEVKNETDLQMPLDFLIEQITLRERMVEEYQSVKQIVNKTLSDIPHCLALLLDTHDPVKWEEACLKIRQWQFYVRLHEEIEVVENEDNTNASTAC